MRYLLALLFGFLSLPAFAQGYLNPPVYATGVINVPAGGTVNTVISNARNPPANLNVFAAGAITTWNVTFPVPPFDGQLIALGCPGGGVSALTVSAVAPTAVSAGGFNSCATNTGATETFQYSQVYDTWYLLLPSAITTNFANLTLSNLINNQTARTNLGADFMLAPLAAQFGAGIP